MTATTTTTALQRAARTWPQRVALTYEDRQWTFIELSEWVESVAAGLAAGGLSGRVLLIAENSPEALVAQLALTRLGVPFATPNPSWTRGELEPAVAPVDAQTVIGEERFRWAAPSFVDVTGLPRATGVAPNPPGGPGNEAYFPFSSGTTGPPKAVRHTRRSLQGAINSLATHLGLDMHDHIQLSLPLCHIFGATMTGAALASGAQLTLFRRFDLEASLTHARERDVTVMPIAGTIAHRLAHHPDLGPLPWLRYFLWGGGPVPASLAAAITARTGVGFLCSYGMTEAMVVAFNPVGDPSRWRLDSPGRPAEGMDVRLTADGEFEVRGATVAAGYVGSDEGWTSDGWFRTGDLGSVDASGDLLVLDRAKDMLKVSGFAVAPSEVEAVLLELDGVRECGVFGVADERYGDVPVAAVVGDVDRAALQEWIGTRLARYKWPHEYVFVDALPRTAGGKLLRRKLPDLIS